MDVCFPVILASNWPLICAIRLFHTWYPVGVRIFFERCGEYVAESTRKFQKWSLRLSGNECDYCLRQYGVLQNLHIFLKWRHSRTLGYKISGLRKILKIDQTDNSLVELLYCRLKSFKGGSLPFEKNSQGSPLGFQIFQVSPNSLKISVLGAVGVGDDESVISLQF